MCSLVSTVPPSLQSYTSLSVLVNVPSQPAFEIVELCDVGNAAIDLESIILMHTEKVTSVLIDVHADGPRVLAPTATVPEGVSIRPILP